MMVIAAEDSTSATRHTENVSRVTSAGILLYRRSPEVQVLLGRLGGPFWERRQSQNWSIPKGETATDENPEQTARREFSEELGLAVPAVALIDLGEVKQKSGKIVRVYAGESDLDLAAVTLGTFELEWPRGSGRNQQFPELAEVQWLTLDQAEPRLISAQVEFLDRLRAAIAAGS
jgi:predicted NUDIX family NTP pyrophosphohydrolase